MQKQAVPLVRAEAPFIGTGVEERAARDAAEMILAEDAGTVTEVDGNEITLEYAKLGTKTYKLLKFERSNQDTSINQKPRVVEGQKVKKGDLLADGPSTDKGELALGKNLLVAFMPWEGYNFEAPRRSPGTSRTSPTTSSPTSTTAASSASAPRSVRATSWSARSPPRARPS
jgi:DNA-directed RNA polymerase subunit beta